MKLNHNNLIYIHEGYAPESLEGSHSVLPMQDVVLYAKYLRKIGVTDSIMNLKKYNEFLNQDYFWN